MVIDQPVRTIDLLPTTLEVLRVKDTSHMDGQSLLPMFTGNSGATQALLPETDYPLRFGWAPLRAVRTDNWKFIEAPRPELYNLSSDAKEANNLYQPSNPKAQEYRQMLEASRRATALSSTPDPRMLPDPKDKIEVQNFLHKGMMAAESGDLETARAALGQAVEADPKSSTALSQLGQVELQARNYQPAAGYLRRALELRPENSGTAFYLGQALSRSGDWHGARDALEASLKLTPGQFEARRLLGEAYLRLNDPKSARDQLEAAMFLDPNDASATRLLAQALVASTEYQRAAEQLEQLVARGVAAPEDFELLRDAYKALGETAKAEQVAARAKPPVAKPPTKKAQ
jgi:predicted Zn-dependent protease